MNDRTVNGMVVAEFRRLMEKGVRDECGGILMWNPRGGSYEAVVSLPLLGEMQGTLTLWTDGVFTGHLESRQIIPFAQREPLKARFKTQGSKTSWICWEFGRRGRLILRVKGPRCNGRPDSWVQEALARFFSRLVDMDKRTRDLFVRE